MWTLSAFLITHKATKIASSTSKQLFNTQIKLQREKNVYSPQAGKKLLFNAIYVNLHD